MARADFGIGLGPGGEILPQDGPLSPKGIPTSPVLPPAALLKLGAYYRGYSTNRSLGDYLVLIALLQLVKDPEAKKALKEVLIRTAAEIGRPIEAQGSKRDMWDKEDFRDMACDDPKEEGQDCLPLFRAIPLPDTNLELLIETPPPYERNFVIGIAPTGPIPTTPIPWAS